MVDSKELGSKIKFAQISSANGCVVQAGITKGSKVTLFGSAIISYESVTSSSMSVSSSPRTSSRGVSKILYLLRYGRGKVQIYARWTSL